MNLKHQNQTRDFMDYIWNKKEVNYVSECMTTSSIIESPVKYSIGNQAFINILQVWLRAFPTIEYQEKELFLNKNTAILKWAVSGRHLGEFYSIAATGKAIYYEGVTQLSFHEGTVSSYSATVNIQEILSQITSTTVEVAANKTIDDLYCAVKELLAVDLSIQQIKCIALASMNYSLSEIAKILSIKKSTVETYFDRAYLAMGIKKNKKMLIEYVNYKNTDELLVRVAQNIKKSRI